MAGIYLHIPFCKKACHYCDFHFSTSLKNKPGIVTAMLQEIALQKDFFEDQNQEVQTIYFGGGTPSLLSEPELQGLLEQIYSAFNVSQNAEITLEANPDDLSEEKIISLKKAGINRLSIGIQSFRDKDLELMNRSHNAKQAETCVKLAQDKGIENITIDLIYGIPGLSNEHWLDNLNKALTLNVPHISSYCLTVEEKTALSHFVKTGKIAAPDDEKSSEQFFLMVDLLDKNGFIHYEISNFCKDGKHSKHNSSYWEGKKYLGLGPSAHSFNGRERFWNISNNATYVKSITENILPRQSELIDEKTAYNEYILTSLRTKKGISLNFLKAKFGKFYLEHCLSEIAKINSAQLDVVEDRVSLTREGKLYADGIAANLFVT
jgi:oxygen-independent coproporphyrinogen III oxidase